LLDARRQAARAPLADGALLVGQGRAQLELAAAVHGLHGSAGIALSELARDRLRRTRRLASRAASEAAQGSADELHRLRILFKRLRYGLDFFAPLWPEDEVRRYAQTLASLQEDLGALNDAAVGNQLLAELAGSDPGLAAARAFASGWHAPRIARLRQQLPEKACELLERRPPWKKKG
jgi:adenylate cyclase